MKVHEDPIARRHQDVGKTKQAVTIKSGDVARRGVGVPPSLAMPAASPNPSPSPRQPAEKMNICTGSAPLCGKQPSLSGPMLDTAQHQQTNTIASNIDVSRPPLAIPTCGTNGATYPSRSRPVRSGPPNAWRHLSWSCVASHPHPDPISPSRRFPPRP